MESFASRLRSTLAAPSARRFGFIISLLLVYAGQRLIRASETLSLFPSLADAVRVWSDRLYLTLEQPFNILVGFILLLAGAVLFGKSVNLPALKQEEQISFESKNLNTNWKWTLPWLAGSLVLFAAILVQLARHEYSAFLMWIWLGTLLVPSALLWKHEHKSEVDLGLAITRVDGIWMLALFAFAIATGCFLLNDLPAGWIPDEGRFWRMAMRIATGVQEPPILGFGVFTFPVASSILQAWIMRYTGITMWGWRFASVLPAALTVFPLYLLARDLFDRRVAVAAGMMMIVNPYYLVFARLGYNNSQSLLPVTLCIYLLVTGIRKNSKLYIWLAGLAAGLGFYTYFAAWLGLVLAIMILCCLAWLFRRPIQSTLYPLGLLIAGALGVMLPRIFYGMSDVASPSLYHRILGTSLVSGFYGRVLFGDARIAPAIRFAADGQAEVFYDLGLYGIVLLRGFVRSTAALFDTLGYADHPITFGMAGPIACIFLILGLSVTVVDFRKLRSLVAALWFLAGFVFLGVSASLPPRPTHMVAMIPAMALLSAIGLVSFLDSIIMRNAAAKITARWNSLAFTTMLLIVVAAGLFQYFFMVTFTYPPNMDDYISWLGRQLPKPASLILVDHHATTRNPRDESLLRLTQHNVILLMQSDIETHPDDVASWRDFAAVVGIDSNLAEQLAGQIPGAMVKAGYVPFNGFRGYIVTDMDVNTVMDLSFSHGIRDLWTSPARNILLLCVAGVLILGVLEVRKQAPLLRSKIARRNREAENR